MRSPLLVKAGYWKPKYETRKRPASNHKQLTARKIDEKPAGLVPWVWLISPAADLTQRPVFPPTHVVD